MTCEIRTCTQNDLSAIAKIQIENWTQTYKDILPDDFLDRLNVPDSMKDWVTFLDQANHKISVILIDDTVAGFIATSIDKKIQNAVYVDSLHISKDFQGMGLGSRLLKEVLEKENERRVTICILKENQKARSLYTRLGAVHLEYFQDNFGNVVTESEKLIW